LPEWYGIGRWHLLDLMTDAHDVIL